MALSATTTRPAVATGSPAFAPGTRRKGLSPHARREERAFWAFLTPWLVGFVFFSGGPVLASFALSFTDYSLINPPSWTGLDNYRTLVHDPLFYTTLSNTLYFGVASVALSVVLTLGMAVLLNQNVRGQALFRLVFYLPSVVAGIATALLWLNIFDPDFGLMNAFLGLFGINGPGWLQDPHWSIPALVIMTVWGSGNTIIIYLAGLQGISVTLYEAAVIDGASALRRFRHVTLPMMSPIIFFNVVTGLIASVQSFVLIFIMTNGGPADSTLVYGLYIYRQAFQYFHMGYASALAVVLFVVIIAVTLIQFRLSRRWVHYEGK